MKKAEYRHLMGLCLYYLGIGENYKKGLCYKVDELEAFRNAHFKNYINKSAELGCELAITYLHHRRLNSEIPSNFN